jgi:hypothetical protein
MKLLTMLLAVALIAASPVTGTWSLQTDSHDGHAYFDLSTGDGAHEHGFTIRPETTGLTPAQLQSSGNKVAFTVLREAGAIACEGWIASGKGGGTFTFSPDPAYAQAMQSMGYPLDADRQLTFAALDITTEYARAMRAEFSNANVSEENLIALRALGVTPEYLSSMRGIGFTVRQPEDAIKLRALRIDVAYVREWVAAGYSNLSAEQLVELKAMRIDAAYLMRVQAHGFPHPSVDELVRLKALNVI